MMQDDAALELSVRLWTWFQLMRELRRRGAGKRESGAFLLGKRLEDWVSIRGFVCYDDLDPRALDRGFICFASRGYPKLWERCRAVDLDVVADIHTHPGANTAMSATDRQHPMLPNVGHYALIVPDFAQGWAWSLHGVSVHRYGGDLNWQSWSSGDGERPLRLTVW